MVGCSSGEWAALASLGFGVVTLGAQIKARGPRWTT